MDDIGRGFLSLPVFGEPVAPPPMYGARVTSHLTQHAVRQIKGAAIKAHMLGLGLETFVTFTLGGESRKAIAEGGLVLGHEIRRTLNGVQERFRREGYEDFAYIWVAENPAEVNPHVHMPTNHTVPRSEFQKFTKWFESLWGHGFAHVERIRKPEAAGLYILKAVGYSAKGSDGGQGLIYGNRYGISQNIRTHRESFDIYDEPEVAEGLLELIRSLEPGVSCEPLGRLWLTSHGLAFPAGTTIAQVGATLEAIKAGVLGS